VNTYDLYYVKFHTQTLGPKGLFTAADLN